MKTILRSFLNKELTIVSCWFLYQSFDASFGAVTKLLGSASLVVRFPLEAMGRVHNNTREYFKLHDLKTASLVSLCPVITLEVLSFMPEHSSAYILHLAAATIESLAVIWHKGFQHIDMTLPYLIRTYANAVSM